MSQNPAGVDGGPGESEQVPLLWPADTGSLAPSSRRALVQLLRGPYLSAARHGGLWAALLNDESVVRSRLADVYLDLVVDTDQQVAFVRNVEHDGLDAPRVVRTASLTFIDTAILLHLRQQLLSAGSGERVIVGQDEVADHLMVYRGSGDTDPALFGKRVNASWDKLKKYGILAATSTEGRFEVSPVLRLIFGPEQIAAVRSEYEKLARSGVSGSRAGGPPETEHEELRLDVDEEV